MVNNLVLFRLGYRFSFVDVVRGFGNKRGDVDDDPCRPRGDAKRLGAELFDRLSTDYCLDTPRGNSLWS